MGIDFREKARVNSKEYEDNYDRIFGKKTKEKADEDSKEEESSKEKE